MIDLERSLTDLADRLVIPDAGWLADDVVRQIGGSEPQRQLQRGSRRRPLAVAAAFVVAVVIVTLVLPGPRRTLARWLGFDSVRIEPAPAVPVISPTPRSLAPGSVPMTAVATTTTLVPPDLDLGPALTKADAMSATGLPDPTPDLLGQAQSVHVVRPPEAGQIVLVYPASDAVPQSPVTGVGALVSVMPAHIDDGMFRKMLVQAATVQSVDVAGSPGFWIDGTPHELVFESNGKFESDTFRLATNTLLWQRGDFLFRIEADISLDTALRIAESVAVS